MVLRDPSGTELAAVGGASDGMERAYDDPANDHAVRPRTAGAAARNRRRPPILETRELEACDGTVQR